MKRGVIEVIASSFDTKKACPHCYSVKLYRFGVVSGWTALSLSRLSKNLQRTDQDTVSPSAQQAAVAELS
jgi:hypothetical protein